MAAGVYGMSGSSVSTHDCVKRLDVVEISPQVLEVADRFHEVNRDALHGAERKDLDVEVHVDDGRNFVLRSKEQWGVLTLEPLMPYTPAAIHLYTEDFYRECAPRLAPGGVMCQWIPLQGMSGQHFKQLVSAFVAVFPDSAVFFVDGAVALIGGNEPLSLKYARVAERLSEPAAKADLAAVGFDDPVRALATFIAGGEELRKLVKDVEPVTDEHPVLEFHPIPPKVLLKHIWENLQIMRDLRDGYERLPVDLEGVADRDAVEARMYLALRGGKHLLAGEVLLEESNLLSRLSQGGSGAAAEQATQAALAAREAIQLAFSVDPANLGARRTWESIERELETGRGNDALAKNDFPAAEAHFRRALEFAAARQADVAWTLLAETLSRAEKFEDALAAATEATRLFPRGQAARCERAYARAALGDQAGAAQDYRHALDGDDLATLKPPRIQHDAERVLPSSSSGDARPLGERIDAALRGEKTARIPASQMLAIFAADEPVAYAAHFARDLEAAASGLAGVDARLAAFERLARALPPGTSDAAAGALAEREVPAPLAQAAATALAKSDPRRLYGLLAPATPVVALSAVVKAAAATGGFQAVDRLLPLLLHADLDVRRGAQLALFARLGGQAPGLARLDPAAFPSKAYRDSVDTLRAWWLRERDQVSSGR